MVAMGPDRFESREGITYERFAPSDRLRPFVESLWVQAAGREAAGARQAPTRVLPSGAAELLLYLGDPFVRLTGRGRLPEPAFALAGQRTRAVRVQATGRTGIVIVRFHPWGAAAFFAPPMGSLQDRTVPVADLVGRRPAAELLDRIDEAPDAAGRLRTIEGFLIRRLDAARADPLAVACALRIRRRLGGEPIEALARAAGLSRRQLTRRFEACIGMSPKKLAGLVRFQESIRQRRRGKTWAEVAVAAGFFDQSHLIRAWQAFAGGAPARLWDGRRRTRLGRFFRGEGRPSVFYNTSYL